MVLTARRAFEWVPKLWIATQSQAKSSLCNLCMFHIFCFRARCTYFSFCSLTRLACEMIGLFRSPSFFWTRTSYVDIRYLTISKFSLGKCSDLFSGYFPSPIWSSVLLFYISVKNGTGYLYWILVVRVYACSLIRFRNLFHLVLTLKHRAGSTAIAAEKRKRNRFVSQLGLRGSDPPI